MEIKPNNIYFGDCYELIKEMKDKSVDIIITDPPYEIEGLHNGQHGIFKKRGGKDSTILHYLLDMALPNNKIPRVFIDTGIEYQMIREFVLGLAKNDDRFVILKPTQNIKQMLEKYGYPFKSKQHSHNLYVYQNSGIGLSVKRYLGIIESNTKFRCPKMLEYQFTSEFKIKCSDNCCRKMKKEPIKKWEKQNDRHIAITGMRNSEGGERASIKGCILTDKSGNITKFHPLIKVNDTWENWFIEYYNDTHTHWHSHHYIANLTISKEQVARVVRSH